MVRAEFREPNFRCRVSRSNRPNEKSFGRLIHAPSEASARELLARRGLIIHSIKPYDFNEWKTIAKRATKLAIKQYKKNGKFEARSAMWIVLKEHLQDLFYGKCAYCEARFIHVAFGDVEHFRPKGKVTGDDGHPGYYWLAYDHTNYLPSCQLCNQGSAKKNQFPIAGRRARKPLDSLNMEKALLLTPYDDQIDPSRYLEFIPSTDPKLPGEVRGIGDRGKESVRVYELDRHDLNVSRKEEQESVRLRLKEALNNEKPEALAKLIEECRSGIRQFSRAAMAEIKDYYKTMGLHPPSLD